MNSLQTKFDHVVKAYATYQAAKKRSAKYTGQLVPSLAKSYVQKAQQELAVLETNLTYFQAIARRATPRVNARFTKTHAKNMQRAITMFKRYIADTEAVYKAWSKYTVKRTNKTVSLVTFPIRTITSNQSPLKLSEAINAYFKAVRRMYNNGAQRNNRPIMPFKRNTVNVRGMSLAKARHVETPADVLRHNVAMLTDHLEQSRRQKLISQAEYKKLKSRADLLEERVAILENWCIHN
jgi:hypothetical protein